MATVHGGWEDLRKLARKLENEVDVKLVAFSKLGGPGASVTGVFVGNERSFNDSSSDMMPLLSREDAVDVAIADLEQLLAMLSGVVDDMTKYVGSQGRDGQSAPPTAALQHTLQRHCDILHDYAHDFQKTKLNIQSQRDRDNLLTSVRRDIEAHKNSTGLTRRSELYLKENEHIRNSDRLVDEQISIAMQTRHHLSSQRIAFRTIQGRINTLVNRFPIINSLVQRINFRKRRDSIVLGLVIGTCLIFLLIYAWH